MNFDVVRTIENKCKRCYNCVRYCPAKAIKVVKGQAIVLPERCIGCGNCVKVCTQNAKEIYNSTDNVKKLLRSGKTMVALLAPSFPGELEDNVTPGQLVSAYRKMGFHKVMEVAFGADLVSREYKKLFDLGGRAYITSACPAADYYIQKYHHDLIDNITPVVSPMIATALVAREEYGQDIVVVFIGPCIAKKKEARGKEVKNLVDEVLTFQESRKIRAEMGIKLENLDPSSFDPPHPSWGRAYPISGGALKSAELRDDVIDPALEVIDGRERFLDFINDFQAGKTECRMVEILVCEGCINGPMMKTGVGNFARKKKISDYIKATQRAFNVEDWQFYMKKYSNLDLTRSFLVENVELREPTDREIKEALLSLNKFEESDELNCKSCGYDSCRSLAKAICEGIAEKEMCIIYTIDELEKTLDELNHSHKELQTTQQQLIQSEKQASLGQLAAGVAHELNNPLGSILLYAELLLKESKADIQGKADLKFIAKEAQRCKNIVAGLLNFSRQREIFCRKVDLNKLIKETSNLIISQKDRDATKFNLNLEEDIPPVELDPEQIKQVIVNLIMNAIEAFDERGQIDISTEYLETQNKVQISVADDGPGIPQDNIKKLFTPFFTTKQIGQGTGLGLAICYGIIKMHRGDIRVKTKVGEGTRFTITLPVFHNTPTKSEILGESADNRPQVAVAYQPRRFSRIQNK